MSFNDCLIDVTITLASGTYDASNGADTVKLSGLRVDFESDNAGQNQQGSARVTVYGMSLALMNRLTVLAYNPLAYNPNRIRVDAGYSAGSMTTVFTGTITNAVPDFQGAPEVPFRIDAQVGFVNQVMSTQPRTFAGTQSVAVMVQQICAAMIPDNVNQAGGMRFENNGVTATLTDMYLHGSLQDQLNAIAAAARIDVWKDGTTVAICPRGVPRKTGEVVLISPQTGLVGWPQIDKRGVLITVAWNPAINQGSQINVQSEIATAAGMWAVYSLSHRLQSQVPGGSWFSHLSASKIPGSVLQNG